MLGGQTFGEAVRAAREEIWVRHPDVNTWGAYQCYGDPSYRLHGDGGNAPRRGEVRYHSPAELIVDLQNDVEQIRMTLRETSDTEETLTALRDQIGKRLASIPAEQRET